MPEVWISVGLGVLILAILAYQLFGGKRAAETGLKSATQDIRKEIDDQFQKQLMMSIERERIARDETLGNYAAFRKQMDEQWDRLNAMQEANWRSVDTRIANMIKENEMRMNELQSKVEKRLDELRRTVDEQLNETLHKRVQSSFETVSKQLESLQQSLGKVDALRTDVTSLQRVFTNVKTRGTWGEVQLGALLDQMLSPQQYDKNVKVNPRSATVVEYAIRMPGRGDGQEQVWLPIDSKFPIEDYLLLSDAQEKGDMEAVRELTKRLLERVRGQARDVRDKYILPPHTTDFAILYLPIEGLFAEVIRAPGFMEQLQRECRVTIAGPTTLAAFLNSLQMGFRTLAVQKYSSEVWRLLGAVKKTMDIHRVNLEKAYNNLRTSVNQLDDARRNANTISSRLDKVEDIPQSQADALLPGITLESGEKAG